MHTIILTGVLDYRPQLAICHSGLELRRALATWFSDLVPVLDVLGADAQDIEDAIGEAMAPSDWTALECFPLTNDGLAFTGDALGIGAALEYFAEDEPPSAPAGDALSCPSCADV